MKNRSLYILWGILYIVCALLGCIPAPQGVVKVLLVILSVLFFVPGGLLLYRGIRNKDHHVRLIRNISVLSLGFTLLALIVNFLSVTGSALIGNISYGFLILVSSPMICSQYWFVSLFLWACLFFASSSHLPKK